MAEAPDRVLADLLRTRARPEGQVWLEDTAAGVASGALDLAVAFPAVGRQVGRGGLDAPGAELVTADGARIPLAAWRVDDAARVRLLLAAARRAPANALARACELYRHGDARERTGALRALSLLPGADHDATGLAIILDAMRISQGEIFEAALLDNPYASRHLPQHEWRKAVLKVVFGGMAMARIAGLAERVDAELAQSLVDFALEREAAGRVVPTALWAVAARFPPPGLAAKLLGYLEHPSDEQRAAAAAALGLLVTSDPRVRPFLIDRAAREPSLAVAAALRHALVE